MTKVNFKYTRPKFCCHSESANNSNFVTYVYVKLVLKDIANAQHINVDHFPGASN
jgi:hypothetical protein